MKKLAVITTHPVQYYAPVFRLLNERRNIGIHVFYTWGKDSQAKFDPGFQRDVQWDIPLLNGYPFSWMRNTAKDPGSHHFNGIRNPELISAVKNYEPDAVLVIGWAYHSHLKALRYFKGKILVLFRGDSTLIDAKPGIRNILRGLFLRWVYCHVDYAFYPGKNSKAYFRKFGVPENRLIPAPHAVDNGRFISACTLQAQEIRRKTGLGDADLMILFAGKFEPKKDPLLLLEAFSRLQRDDVHLVFAGSGELELELKSKAEINRVHFLPFQNQTEMPALYEACDLFCLPSKGPGETWGLAVNEAMACGKPVLVSDKVGSAPDLISDGKNGYVFRAGDVYDLQEKLGLMLSDRKKLMNMGEASREKIASFTFTHIALALEKQVQNELPYPTSSSAK